LTPIDQISAAQVRELHTVITDIDDTLTTDGMLTAKAYSALEHLRCSGLRTVITTGRPAGWCDHIARMWPVDAVVGENGAFCYWYDRQARKLSVRHSLTPQALQAKRQAMDAVAAQILADCMTWPLTFARTSPTWASARYSASSRSCKPRA